MEEGGVNKRYIDPPLEGTRAGPLFMSLGLALSHPSLWLETGAHRGGAPPSHQEWSRGRPPLCFGDPFCLSHLSRQTTSRAASAETKTSEPSPSTRTAALQTVEQRSAAQEKTRKFLDRLSSQSFPYSALCRFGIAKSPGRCCHDEIFNHHSSTPPSSPEPIAVNRRR
jgi:hypothetical protein